MDFREVRSIAWRTIAEFFGFTEPTAALTGAGTTTYLRGDGTWKKPTTNAVDGTLTLTANAATTTLTDSDITTGSMIIAMPTTANAAAAQAGLWFSTFAAGSCGANHANNAQVDRTFTYLVWG